MKIINPIESNTIHLLSTMIREENEEPKKRAASDVYDRQIRLWGKEAQVRNQVHLFV